MLPGALLPGPTWIDSEPSLTVTCWLRVSALLAPTWLKMSMFCSAGRAWRELRSAAFSAWKLASHCS